LRVADDGPVVNKLILGCVKSLVSFRHSH